MSYILIEVKDLKSGSIYAKVNPRTGNVKPTLVYLSTIFKGDEYEEATRGLNYHDVTGLSSIGSRRGSLTEFALYTRLNENAFTSWIVAYACDSRNGAGFMEVSRELISEMEEFLKHVDTLEVVADLIQQKLTAGFPTILDALVRVTGQTDLKKKIEKEPQLVKLFKKIDDSLS